jgi:hypothetical protein
MEKTPPLTTAAEIIAAYKTVSADLETEVAAEANGLLNDLCRLFVSKPVDEMRGCPYQDMPSMDGFVSAGESGIANAWLERGYAFYPDGSEEIKAVVAMRLSLVDAFAQVGMLANASMFLNSGYLRYPNGSEEYNALVAKQEELRQKMAQPKLSVQLGSGWNIATLKEAVKGELAKISQPAFSGTDAPTDSAKLW